MAADESGDEDGAAQHLFGELYLSEGLLNMTPQQLQEHGGFAERQLAKGEEWRPAAVELGGLMAGLATRNAAIEEGRKPCPFARVQSCLGHSHDAGGFIVYPDPDQDGDD